MTDGELVLAALERLEAMQQLSSSGNPSLLHAIARVLDVDEQAAEMLMRAAARVTDALHGGIKAAGNTDWQEPTTIWAVALTAGIEVGTAVHKAREELR